MENVMENVKKKEYSKKILNYHAFVITLSVV